MAGEAAGTRHRQENAPQTVSQRDLTAGQGTAGPFAAVTVLFFFWGFITVMNDVLIPFLKSSFELSYFQAGLVQFAFFGAFFVVSPC
jgi:fucose permease